MLVTMTVPSPDRLPEAVVALRGWQRDAAPMQLHPGDIGWFWRHGASATAAALRVWSRDGAVLAVGLLDGSRQLRMTTAPAAREDRQLARAIVADVTRPERGVLPAGRVAVEAPRDALVQDLLRSSTFTASRWHAMVRGSPYAEARCLLAYDDSAAAVAAVTIWSAGSGRPGLLEPMGVHREHRGRGFGTAITLAAAAALREMGASSAIVCTPSSNVGGVATYLSAGFRACPEVRDRYRDA
jgi:ribosomal protein S18 acetylase RimI-like enzyme